MDEANRTIFKDKVYKKKNEMFEIQMMWQNSYFQRNISRCIRILIHGSLGFNHSEKKKAINEQYYWINHIKKRSTTCDSHVKG